VVKKSYDVHPFQPNTISVTEGWADRIMTARSKFTSHNRETDTCLTASF